jgi:hypothetical protein
MARIFNQNLGKTVARQPSKTLFDNYTSWTEDQLCMREAKGSGVNACPLCGISGHSHYKKSCLLYARKQTFGSTKAISFWHLKPNFWPMPTGLAAAIRRT